MPLLFNFFLYTTLEILHKYISLQAFNIYQVSDQKCNKEAPLEPVINPELIKMRSTELFLFKDHVKSYNMKICRRAHFSTKLILLSDRQTYDY